MTHTQRESSDRINMPANSNDPHFPIDPLINDIVTITHIIGHIIKLMMIVIIMIRLSSFFFKYQEKKIK